MTKIVDIATHLLIRGDFNLVIDPNKDSYNYSNVNNAHARTKVLQIMSELRRGGLHGGERIE